MSQRGAELAATEAARQLAVQQRAAAALAAARMPPRMQAAADATRGPGSTLKLTPNPALAADPAAQAHAGAAFCSPRGKAARAAAVGASAAAPAQQVGRGAGAAGGDPLLGGRCDLGAAARRGHACGWARPVPDFAALHAAWAGRLSAARAATAQTAVKPFRLGLAPARRRRAHTIGHLADTGRIAGPVKAGEPGPTSPGGADAAPGSRAQPVSESATGAAACHADYADASDARPEGRRLPVSQRVVAQRPQAGQPSPDLDDLDPQETLAHAMRRAGGCTGACLAALRCNMAALHAHTCAELRAERLAADAAALRSGAEALFA